MKLNIEVDIEIVEKFENNKDVIAHIEYPDEGNKIYVIKGLNKIEFEDALLHEIGHLFDWYLCDGKQSEKVEIREKNAEALEYLDYKRILNSKNEY